jgi:hypothetical protein
MGEQGPNVRWVRQVRQRFGEPLPCRTPKPRTAWAGTQAKQGLCSAGVAVLRTPGQGLAAGLGAASAQPGMVWLGENRRFERPIQGGIRPVPKQSTSAHRLGKRSMEAKRRKTVTAHPPNRRRSHPPALHPSGTKRMSIKRSTNNSSINPSVCSRRDAERVTGPAGPFSCPMSSMTF